MVETVLAERIQAVLDSETGRIVGRLTKDVDLLEGIKEVCRNNNLEAAQFQCMGSLLHATYVQLEETDQGVLSYSPKVKSDTAVELLSGTGFVGIDQEGELDVHFHGLFVDCNQKITGGHFIHGENPVAVTVEFILFPLPKVKMQRGNDEIYGLPVFQFSKKE
ncbi:DNA-binding protein [Sporosarcina sp. E16_3]|nr:DNA-binding protein [Sporosarcina sp. E16_3]